MKYLQTIYVTNNLYLEYRNNSQNSTEKSTQSNWEKNVKRYFTEEEHMKWGSASLAIRKMPIKTTVGFLTYLLEQLKLKIVTIPNASHDAEKLILLYIV